MQSSYNEASIVRGQNTARTLAIPDLDYPFLLFYLYCFLVGLMIMFNIFMGWILLVWDKQWILVEIWCTFVIVYLFTIDYELLISYQFSML